MNKTVIHFGAYSVLLAFSLFLSGLYFGKGMDFSAQEIIGYTTIIASLTLVYFGIKHYRDKVNGKRLTFKNGMLTGILISLFPALGIAIADYIYTSVINPDFFKEYVAMMKAQGHTGEIPEYSSGFMAMIMFFTVMIVGLVVSLISATLLRTKA